jgi:transcriptional regulator GlxA family with amidase domain
LPKVISIFVHERAAVSFALLAASVFRIGNRVAGSTVFEVQLVGCQPRFEWQDGEIRLQPATAAVSGDYLIVSPMEAVNARQHVHPAESDLLRQCSQAGTTVASACLGAFLPAAAGLLDGREATTHWQWVDFAQKTYPDVRWNTREMLVDHGDIITSGGLLSIVDLCLHIVRKKQGSAFMRELGQILLADTARQKQSVYATRLIAAPKNAGTFQALEQEIDRRGTDALSVEQMAEFCHMSLRSFHRRFQENYGLSPIKFLQLRRIEKAKALLTDASLPLEVVAEQVGFGDMAFFRAVFSRETGMTPGQFRRNMTETTQHKVTNHRP